MSSAEIAEKVISMYEKHNVRPGSTNAFPFAHQPDITLCALGIATLDSYGRIIEGTCDVNGDEINPYKIGVECLEVESSPIAFALGFDRGFEEARGNIGGETHYNRGNYRQGYEVGRAVGKWWNAKQELEQMEGSPYVGDRSPALVSS